MDLNGHGEGGWGALGGIDRRGIGEGVYKPGGGRRTRDVRFRYISDKYGLREKGQTSLT